MALGSEVTVKRLKGHPRYSWRATFIESGERKQKYFETKAAAEEWAENRAEESLDHGTASALSAKERSAVIDSRDLLSETGLDLREAIAFAAKAKAALATYGVSPDAALDLALDHYRRARKSITVSALVEEVISAKKSAGRSKRHERDLRSKLDRFAIDFGERSAAVVESGEIEDWLHGLKLAPGSVNSYRRIVSLAFAHAVKRGYAEKNPVSAIDQVREREQEPVVLTVREINALLTHASDAILPAFALAAFAGLRSSEIEGTADHDGLDWSEIDFDEGTILVRADVAKGRRKRHVSMTPNLVAWLKPLAKKSGPVWPENGRKLHEATRRLARFGSPGSETDKEKAKKVKLKPWPKNALRHSYASYHLAHFKNPAELVMNMGHKDDADTVYNHYRGIVKPKDAEAYWSLGPAKKAGKIVRLSA